MSGSAPPIGSRGSRAGPRSLRCACRDDLGAGRERGREDAEVAREVRARARHERDEALDELVRREHEGGRAVSPGALELELQAAVFEAGESIRGDRRAREIARHALEAGAIGGGDARGRLQVEAADLGAQATEHGGGRAANANDVPKTGNVRSVPLTAELAEVLRDHRRTAGTVTEGWVFSNADGEGCSVAARSALRFAGRSSAPESRSGSPSTG